MKRTRVRLFIIVVTLGIVAFIPIPTGALDLSQFEQIRFGYYPAISPDAAFVAYQVRRFDIDSDKIVDDVYLASVGGKTSTYVGQGEQPMWSSDTKYLSVVRGSSSPDDLWVVSTATHGFTAVPHGKVATEDSAIIYGSVRWNPKREQLGFVRQSDRGHNSAFAVFYPVTNSERVFDGTEGVLTFDFMPNGSEAILAIGDHLMLLRLSDGKLRQLYTAPAPIIDVVVSHGGDKVAYFTNNGKGSDPLRPHVFDMSTARDRAYGTSFILWRLHYGTRFFEWQKQDRALLIGILSHGAYRIFALNLATDSMRAMTPAGIAPYWFTTDAQQRYFAFMSSSSNVLPEVAISPMKQFRPEKITALNRRPFTLARSTPFSWRSSDGLRIEGLLMMPPGRPHKPVPLIVLNEGTHGMFDLSFSSRDVSDNGYLFPFQQQLFADRGWAVLMPNPRASWGRTFLFNGMDVGDYGIGPTNDILSGINELASAGLIDPHRVAMIGLYTDAYRAALATARDKRIRAAVVMNGWYDLTAWYTESDPSYVRRVIGGTPSTARQRFDSISPFQLADNVRADTLCITSEASPGWFGVQSMRYCRALRKFGTKSKTIALPLDSWDRVTPDVFEQTETAITDWLQRDLAK